MVHFEKLVCQRLSNWITDPLNIKLSIFRVRVDRLFCNCFIICPKSSTLHCKNLFLIEQVRFFLIWVFCLRNNCVLGPKRRCGLYFDETGTPTLKISEMILPIFILNFIYQLSVDRKKKTFSESNWDYLVKSAHTIQINKAE